MSQLAGKYQYFSIKQTELGFENTDNKYTIVKYIQSIQ